MSLLQSIFNRNTFTLHLIKDYGSYSSPEQKFLAIPTKLSPLILPVLLFNKKHILPSIWFQHFTIISRRDTVESKGCFVPKLAEILKMAQLLKSIIFFKFINVSSLYLYPQGKGLGCYLYTVKINPIYHARFVSFS